MHTKIVSMQNNCDFNAKQIWFRCKTNLIAMQNWFDLDAKPKFDRDTQNKLPLY